MPTGKSKEQSPVDLPCLPPERFYRESVLRCERKRYNWSADRRKGTRLRRALNVTDVRRVLHLDCRNSLPWLVMAVAVTIALALMVYSAWINDDALIALA
jgi:hypothetical protein